MGHAFAMALVQSVCTAMKDIRLLEQRTCMVHVFSAENTNPSRDSSLLIKKLARYANYLSNQ